MRFWPEPAILPNCLNPLLPKSKPKAKDTSSHRLEKKAAVSLHLLLGEREVAPRKSGYCPKICPGRVQRTNLGEEPLPEEIASAIQSYFPDTDRSILIRVIKRYKDQDSYADNPVIDPDEYGHFLRIMSQAGELPKNVPYEQLIDPHISQKIVDELKGGHHETHTGHPVSERDAYLLQQRRRSHRHPGHQFHRRTRRNPGFSRSQRVRKSTILSLLAGIYKQTSGQIRLFGKEGKTHAAKYTGYMLQRTDCWNGAPSSKT